ncbi:hypothetical protein [Actinokineospora xionganensis]|uniref:Uncharacterized protein n=1 Tax=Actinokineospora xionganensis TaxID=2684470 RepID=A0ABR7L282_9PSEU|nr:hypothetical protein [Actinokineospora xionganensis]MBC6446583.1 hypothetical protein [Actinokineospora xionganensis]
MTDAELLAELAGMLDRVDPVPATVRTAAMLAGTFVGARWDWLELSPLAGVAVRGGARMWRCGAGVIEIADRVSGLLTVPVTRAELHSAAGVLAVAVDSVGAFSAQLPTGRMRLVLHRAGDVPLVTRWFR